MGFSPHTACPCPKTRSAEMVSHHKTDTAYRDKPGTISHDKKRETLPAKTGTVLTRCMTMKYFSHRKWRGEYPLESAWLIQKRYPPFHSYGLLWLKLFSTAHSLIPDGISGSDELCPWLFCEPKPYGRFWWPFSCENHALSFSGSSWADKFSALRYTLLSGERHGRRHAVLRSFSAYNIYFTWFLWVLQSFLFKNIPKFETFLTLSAVLIHFFDGVRRPFSPGDGNYFQPVRQKSPGCVTKFPFSHNFDGGKPWNRPHTMLKYETNNVRLKTG